MIRLLKQTGVKIISWYKFFIVLILCISSVHTRDTIMSCKFVKNQSVSQLNKVQSQTESCLCGYWCIKQLYLSFGFISFMVICLNMYMVPFTWNRIYLQSYLLLWFNPSWQLGSCSHLLIPLILKWYRRDNQKGMVKPMGWNKNSLLEQQRKIK